MFSATAPKLWNSLPKHTHEIKSLAAFKKNVKTYLLDYLLRSFEYILFYFHFIYAFFIIVNNCWIPTYCGEGKGNQRSEDKLHVDLAS